MMYFLIPINCSIWKVNTYQGFRKQRLHLSNGFCGAVFLSSVFYIQRVEFIQFDNYFLQVIRSCTTICEVTIFMNSCYPIAVLTPLFHFQYSPRLHLFLIIIVFGQLQFNGNKCDCPPYLYRHTSNLVHYAFKHYMNYMLTSILKQCG